MKILKLLKISDLFTFANIISAITSIISAILGKFNLAIILLLACVFFDYFDGRSAKKRNIANEFGKQLDSLADIIGFGVVPSIIVFLLFKNIIFIWVYFIFVLSGVLRLARFNITSKKGHFEGMPITLNGVFIPLLFIFNSTEIVYYVYMVLASLLMVSSIKIKKI